MQDMGRRGWGPVYVLFEIGAWVKGGCWIYRTATNIYLTISTAFLEDVQQQKVRAESTSMFLVEQLRGEAFRFRIF